MKVLVLIALIASPVLVSSIDEICNPCNTLNYVPNPSFENLNINLGYGSWTSGTDIVVDWQATTSKIEVWNELAGDGAHGSYYLELRPDSSDGVKTTINDLVIGKTYQISFNAGARPGVNDNPFRVLWNDVQVGDDVFLDTADDGNQLVWHLEDDYYIVADKVDGNTLAIIDPSGSSSSVGCLLDAVALVPCGGCPSGTNNQESLNYDLVAQEYTETAFDEENELVCDVCKAINYVTNPSFEDPDVGYGQWTQENSIDGWLPTYNKIEIWNNLYGAARNGNQHLELCATRPEGITQTVDGLTAGEYYEISFSIAARPGVTENQFRVLWNGDQVGNTWSISDNNEDIVWQDVSVLVKAEVADGNEIIIEDPQYLDGSDSSACSLLDAVSLSPCACPDDCVNTDEYNYDNLECESPVVLVADSGDDELDEEFESGNTDDEGDDDAEEETSDSCVTVYSECDYQGSSMEVCDTYDCFDWSPMSVIVPRGKKVTFYTECNQVGTELVCENDESCLEGLFDEEEFLGISKQTNGKKISKNDNFVRITVK